MASVVIIEQSCMFWLPRNIAVLFDWLYEQWWREVRYKIGAKTAQA